MSYSVSISENGKYVVCKVTGSMTADTAVEFAKEMDKLSHESGIKCFLTDVRNSRNESDAFRNYSYAYDDAEKLKLQRDVRAATLVAKGDDSHDFVETVARNAGYNVRIFDDESSAIAWLTEET